MTTAPAAALRLSTLAAMHLTPTDRLALIALDQSPTPLSLAQLAAAAGATPLTLTHVVRRLRRADLIERTTRGSVAHYTLAASFTK